jgi:hypothetical protein
MRRGGIRDKIREHQLGAEFPKVGLLLDKNLIFRVGQKKGLTVTG